MAIIYMQSQVAEVLSDAGLDQTIYSTEYMWIYKVSKSLSI